MKSLLRHLLKINNLLKKNQIKLSEETKLQLPRSLWRLDFPPPLTDIISCDETCKNILNDFESKWSTIFPIFLLIIIIYLLYIYLL